MNRSLSKQLALTALTLFLGNGLTHDMRAHADDPVNPPDFRTLQVSAYLMGPGNANNPVYRGWKDTTEFMKDVTIFDKLVDRVQNVVCSSEQNKGVLLIGDPSEAYRYLFARMASNPQVGTASKKCANMWHADVDIAKIEAGHKYVGEVDQYWQDNVLRPSDGKDVVMYFNRLGSLVGVGSHSNDSTGIEREYAANITAGRMRTVAFMDKYEYNDLMRSGNAYVVEAFAEKIVLPPLDAAQTDQLIQAYLKKIHPNFSLGAKEATYLYKSLKYFQPNRAEPDRSMAAINMMIRYAGPKVGTEPFTAKPAIESKHPYDPNSNLEHPIHFPDAISLQLVFDKIELEDFSDHLTVVDGRSGQNLHNIPNSAGEYSTPTFNTNKLVLRFYSDSSKEFYGYKLKQVNGVKAVKYAFTMEEVRRVIMEIAQVPRWIMDRDYQIIRDLPGKLDGDVVGVKEGKADLVRMAKIGYVAGRTDDKPVASVLLTGPTGTGKSYIAKRMAEYMEMRLVTLDMTAYKDRTKTADFIEIMSKNLANNPYAIYLFEEIDKADLGVLDLLYFMMDEGIFYDGYQRPLFARGAFMIFTSNAASDVIIQNRNSPELRKLVFNELSKNFRMSFLNRFDSISIFMPFTNEEFLQLANVMAVKKAKNVKENFDWTMTVDAETVRYIATQGRSDVLGARPMERLVENVMSGGLAEYQLQKGMIPDQAKIKITKEREANQFAIQVNEGAKLPYTIVPNHDGSLLPDPEWMAHSPLYNFWAKDRMYND